MLTLLLTGPAHAGVTAPASSPNPSQGVPNPTNWLLQHIFANPFKSSAKKTISSALKASEAAFTTPDVSTQPRVREIWQSLLIISDSMLLLLLVVGAIMVVAGDWTYLEAKQLAPRALVAGLAVNLSLLLLGEGIGISNVLVKGFLQVDPSSLSVTADRLIGTGVAAPLVLALLLIGALFLLLSDIVRIVILVLLAIGGPALQVFGILPQTEGVARGWWRALAACLIAPAAQALLLTIGVKVFFAGQSGVTVPGGNNPGSSNLVDLILVFVILLLMAAIPFWMIKRAIGVDHRAVLRGARRLVPVPG